MDHAASRSTDCLAGWGSKAAGARSVSDLLTILRSQPGRALAIDRVKKGGGQVLLNPNLVPPLIQAGAFNGSPIQQWTYPMARQARWFPALYEHTGSISALEFYLPNPGGLLFREPGNHTGSEFLFNLRDNPFRCSERKGLR